MSRRAPGAGVRGRAVREKGPKHSLGCSCGCLYTGVLQDLSTDLAEPTHSCISTDLEVVHSHFSAMVVLGVVF